jgi:hypothetical protein
MFGRDPWPPSRLASEAERRERLGLLAGDMSFMPNGTLDGFNHVLDFDEGLTHVFRITAIVFLRQKLRDVAAVRNLSISCCDQLLNVFVILSHSGGLLLINLFAQQPPRFELIDRGGFNRPSCATIGRMNAKVLGAPRQRRCLKKTSATNGLSLSF